MKIYGILTMIQTSCKEDRNNCHKYVTVEDEGTYNFASPNEDAIGHFQKDVVTWLAWGNAENDTTKPEQRLKVFVVDGVVDTIEKKLDETAKSIKGFFNKIAEKFS